jgi:hypothetical protein
LHVGPARGDENRDFQLCQFSSNPLMMTCSVLFSRETNAPIR